jgi:hypothetical protein
MFAAVGLAAALLMVTGSSYASPMALEPVPPSGEVDLFPRRPQIDFTGFADSRVKTLWRDWDKAYKAEVRP